MKSIEKTTIELWDRSGQVNPSAYRHIRSRLWATGLRDFADQCDMLASQMGFRGGEAIRHFLLWNLPLPPEQAKALDRWFQLGMPLDRPDPLAEPAIALVILESA
jgi:hypothetical protein